MSLIKVHYNKRYYGLKSRRNCSWRLLPKSMYKVITHYVIMTAQLLQIRATLHLWLGRQLVPVLGNGVVMKRWKPDSHDHLLGASIALLQVIGEMKCSPNKILLPSWLVRKFEICNLFCNKAHLAAKNQTENA